MAFTELQLPYSLVIRQISPIYKHLSLPRHWFLLNNIKLLVINHILVVKHPFPSCEDIGYRCLIMNE